MRNKNEKYFKKAKSTPLNMYNMCIHRTLVNIVDNDSFGPIYYKKCAYIIICRA